MTNRVLRVDASMRHNGSYGRKLADKLVTRLQQIGAEQVIDRDLTKGMPFVDEQWIGANFTGAEERTEQQRAALSHSDALVEEIRNADTLVIAVPIYNFGVPAAYKAWIDMITRARLTFQYGENGPEGLLTGKKAYVIVTSGGTQLGTDIDFVSGWLQHTLGFIGITDVTLIDASGLMKDEQGVLARAEDAIASIGA